MAQNEENPSIDPRAVEPPSTSVAGGAEVVQVDEIFMPTDDIFDGALLKIDGIRDPMALYRDLDPAVARAAQSMVGLAEARNMSLEDGIKTTVLVMTRAFQIGHLVGHTPGLFSDPNEDLSSFLEAS